MEVIERSRTRCVGGRASAKDGASAEAWIMDSRAARKAAELYSRRSEYYRRVSKSRVGVKQNVVKPSIDCQQGS